VCSSDLTTKRRLISRIFSILVDDIRGYRKDWRQ
jgi:hypothetical protein